MIAYIWTRCSWSQHTIKVCLFKGWSMVWFPTNSKFSINPTQIKEAGIMQLGECMGWSTRTHQGCIFLLRTSDPDSWHRRTMHACMHLACVSTLSLPLRIPDRSIYTLLCSAVPIYRRACAWLWRWPSSSPGYLPHHRRVRRSTPPAGKKKHAW